MVADCDVNKIACSNAFERDVTVVIKDDWNDIPVFDVTSITRHFSNIRDKNRQWSTSAR
jgi:hypothetical protein